MHRGGAKICAFQPENKCKFTERDADGTATRLADAGHHLVLHVQSLHWPISIAASVVSAVVSKLTHIQMFLNLTQQPSSIATIPSGHEPR